MSGTEQSRWSGFAGGTLSLILCIALSSALLPTDIVFPMVPSTQARAGSGVYPLAKFVQEGENPLEKLNDARFACQSASSPMRCFSPQQIRTAYNINPLLQQGITGAGRTIVIVDAFQSPTIRQDLQLFDRIFGLPDPVLTIIAPDGLTPFNPKDANHVTWASEITLDVEWAHAIAPGAKITLILAKGNMDRDILSATRFAVETNQGDVISQSFGEGEACSATSLLALHQIFQEATAKNITLLAASGDTGSAQAGQAKPVSCGNNLPYFLSASTPASDPLVTSVGGTHLNADADTGQYISEMAWNNTYGASGGGFSSVFQRPIYQTSIVKNEQRGLPDVALNADPTSGVLVIFSSYAVDAKPMTYTFGGTSAGSPQWAGIIALADQAAGKRLGFINSAIYRIGKSLWYHTAFHDILTGNNTFTKLVAGSGTITVEGYDAMRSWDAATGIGTPNVSKLIPLLIDNKQIGDGSNL
jgi:subtilase family serine protease